MDAKELSRYFREMGRKGGRARASKLPSSLRKQIARRAARARWARANRA